jgi:hypothetical protein
MQVGNRLPLAASSSHTARAVSSMLLLVAAAVALPILPARPSRPEPFADLEPQDTAIAQDAARAGEVN